MLLQEVLLEGAAVHADADGHLALTGRPRHFTHFVRSAYVAGIEPETVDPGPQGTQGEPVIEVNVRDERNGYGVFYPRKLLHRFLIRHRDPHDLTPRLLEAFDLGHRGPPVAGVRIGHGLHHHRSIPADGHVADVDLPGLLT